MISRLTTAPTHGLSNVERRVAELHPYDVPEFLVSPVLSGSAAYLAWVRTSTRV